MPVSLRLPAWCSLVRLEGDFEDPAARRSSTLAARGPTEGAHVRAVVFAGAGGNEVIRVEELPDPLPGSEELLVRVTHAGLNPADWHSARARIRRLPAARATSRDSRSRARVEACGRAGARLAARRPRLRPRRRRRARRPRRRAPAVRRARAGCARRAGAAAVPEAFITAHDAIRSQAGLRPGETLLVHGAAGGVGSAAVQIGVVGRRARARQRAQRRAAALVRELGGEAIADDGFADAVWRPRAGAAQTSMIELVGAPHFPDNLRAGADAGADRDRRPGRGRRGLDACCAS